LLAFILREKCYHHNYYHHCSVFLYICVKYDFEGGYYVIF